MRRIEGNGTVFYASELIGALGEVTAAVTTRHGGVSPAPFDSLNLSAHVGDDPTNVQENLRLVHRALGLDENATVDAKQAQADRVARVRAEARGTRVAGVDGLITNEPGMPLLLRFADCVPILFYDPVRRAVGVAHAGWRGTVSHVVTNTVLALGEAFGTRPGDLAVCVAPSIGPCCYEIGPDVRTLVEQAFPDPGRLVIQRNGATYLDLWEANACQLRGLGVGAVEIAGVCTAHNTADFYSWRQEKAHTGRFAAVIALDR